MRFLSFSLIIFLLPVCCSAQALKKYNIGKSGCAAYFYCNPVKFDLSFSPDSSKVYTGECKDGTVTYDVICVEMKETIKETQLAENVLQEYLDYLKSNFQISTSAGYGKGHRLKGKENTRGIIDYWKDADNNNIRVKGWTNGKYIVVLMVISDKEIQETKATAFLDGLVFPTPHQPPTKTSK